MINFLSGLDPNVIFAFVIGTPVSIGITRYWQWQQQKFEAKVKVIEEVSNIFKIQKAARAFIHNKINFVLNKPQINILDATNKYKDNYKRPDITNFEDTKWKQKLIYFSVVIILLIIIINLIKV